MITKLEILKALGAGALVPAVEGELIKVWEKEPTPDRGYGVGTRQGFSLAMEDGVISGSFWNHKDFVELRGRVVTISCKTSDKGPSGVKLDLYEAKNELQLKVTASAIIELIEGQKQPAAAPVPAYRAPLGPKPHLSAPPASAPNQPPAPHNGNGNGNGRHTLRDVLTRHHVCMLAAEKEVRRLLGYPNNDLGNTKPLSAPEITCIISLAATNSIAADRISAWPASAQDPVPAPAPAPAQAAPPPPPPPPAPVRPPVQQELEPPSKEKDDIPF